MTNENFASRFVSAILILLMASSLLLARGEQDAGDTLSDEDKAEIIESVLQLELQAQNTVAEFEIIRNLSSDNIGFVEPLRITRHGFMLVTASQIPYSQRNDVVQYLVFRKIYSKDGVVVVVLSRVTEGRPCFAPAFSRERSFTYEYRKESGKWIGQLVKRPAVRLPFGGRFSKKDVTAFPLVPEIE